MSHSQIQRLVFGCNSLTTLKNIKLAEEIINHVADQGINTFDTAPIYGKGYSEILIGRILKSSEINITTKFGSYKSPNTFLPINLALKMNNLKKIFFSRGTEKIKKDSKDSKDFKNLNLKTSNALIKKIYIDYEKSSYRLKPRKINSYLIHMLDPFYIDKIAGKEIKNLINSSNIPIMGYSGPLNKKFLNNELPPWVKLIQTKLPEKNSQDEKIIYELLDKNKQLELRFFNVFRGQDISKNIMRARYFLENSKQTKIIFQTRSKERINENIKLLVS